MEVKDLYEVYELILSGECTKLIAYQYYDEDTEIKYLYDTMI